MSYVDILVKSRGVGVMRIQGRWGRGCLLPWPACDGDLIKLLAVLSKWADQLSNGSVEFLE